MRSALVLIATLASGCAIGALQSARTTPKGTTDVTVGATYVDNEQSVERGRSIANFPMHLAVRHGFTDRLDVGASFLLGTGLLVDVKYGFLDPGRSTAFSLSLGAGATTWFASTWAVYVPLAVHVSHELGAFTPYASVGYGAWWFGQKDPPAPPADPRTPFARRTWTGDGVLQVSIGTEWRVGPVTLLAEYTLLQPVVDDPGDFFAFVRNHQLAAGVRF